METNETKEGLITKWIKNWKFNKEFSKEERAELKRLKHQATFDRLKYLAKIEGDKEAEEQLKEAMKIIERR